MRDMLFRAWARRTVDNQFDYAYDTSKNEYENSEPPKYSEEWNDWYENREERFRELMSLWACEHNLSEKCSTSYKMITDISVNGKIQRPFSYTIISVMQYVGFCDKNGKQIFEGDIDQSGYVITYLADLNAGLGMNAGWYLQRDDFESWSELECDENIEIVGNVFENPELAINNCGTNYIKMFS